MERKIFSAERKISSQSTPLKNSAEQDSSSTVLLSFSVKFLAPFGCDATICRCQHIAFFYTGGSVSFYLLNYLIN